MSFDRKFLIKTVIAIFVIIPVLLFFSNFFKDDMPTKQPVSRSQKQVKAVSTEANVASASPTHAQNSSHLVYLGFWTQGLFDPSSATLHPEALHGVESAIKKKVAIAHYYRGWDSLDSPVFLNELNVLSANGWRPMISANPYFFDRCRAGGQPLYKTIAGGACDDLLHSIGKNFHTYAKPVFFRFAWEMNINSMEWSILRTGDSASDFVSAWRRIHEIFYQENASNTLFVFSPDVGGQISYKELYPGDAFVDWNALDGYNWGTTQPWSSWKSFSSVFNGPYFQLISAAPNKPIMISETNTTDKGGNKPSWYQDAFAQIVNNYPQTKAVVVYNENREAKENVNWLIDAVPGSLQAFSKAISPSNFLSSF